MENQGLKEVRIEEQWCYEGERGNNVEEGLGRRGMMGEHRRGWRRDSNTKGSRKNIETYYFISGMCVCMYVCFRYLLTEGIMFFSEVISFQMKGLMLFVEYLL